MGFSFYFQHNKSWFFITGLTFQSSCLTYVIEIYLLVTKITDKIKSFINIIWVTMWYMYILCCIFQFWQNNEYGKSKSDLLSYLVMQILYNYFLHAKIKMSKFKKVKIKLLFVWICLPPHWNTILRLPSVFGPIHSWYLWGAEWTKNSWLSWILKMWNNPQLIKFYY